ncbi:OmpH family outer membrane protein [Sphingomonas sp. MG17]|jgi:Skp family chaperone for outer membrane proteins|uniref:OmpH family outer membrane protein n=1 Tax=Sphingomonas tagetis TaxID=2949092 RepID=A0A9X2HGH3_9SPHN|nr:OmpH family outer membrane protein [Sphingomonas tagetis]MCP3729097.1 OmpH family outer membrane protein [Sphingomonas tagetis]
MRNTKTLLAALAVAGATFGAGAAAAQALADAKVAVVDVDRIMSQCTACVAANGQLQQQRTALQTFAQQQGQPLQGEQTSLEAAVKAAAGKPDAALSTRIQAFQTRAQNAQRAVSEREQTFQRNVQFVQQQIAQKMVPVVQQIAQQRGASVAIARESLLFSATSVDITDAVLATLNQQLPSVSVTAPPPAQPTAPAPAPAQPAPTGR